MRSLTGTISLVVPESIGDEVARPHTKQARRLRSTDGREWIAKSELTIRRKGLRAEVIGHLAARLLGMPTPAGGVAVVNGVRWWCSELVLPSMPWSRAAGERLARPSRIAHLLLLDLLIFNEDRHSDNMLLKPRLDGGFDLLAIDHEEAWIGSSVALPTDRLPSLEKCPETLYEHSKIRKWLQNAANSIANIDQSRWRELANLTAIHVPETDEHALGHLLSTRAATLGTIASRAIREYRQFV